jgi:hypothetical protein
VSTGAALAYLAKVGYVESWVCRKMVLRELANLGMSKTLLRQLVRFGCVEKRPMPTRPRPFKPTGGSHPPSHI